MKKILSIYILVFCTSFGYAQTVVKMVMPKQSDKFIEGYTLFDDALPNSIPTAIGIMGYDISGGTEPYSYKWLEDETVLSNDETMILNPKIGKKYYLQISDKNNCTITIPINVDQTKQSILDDKDSILKQININLTRENLSIQFDEKLIENVEFALYDSNGTLYLRKKISNSSDFKLELKSGVYLLYLYLENKHVVTKNLIY